MIIIGADYDFPRRDLSPEWKYENISEKDLEEMREIHLRGEEQIRAIYEQSSNYEIILTEQQLGNITTKTLLIYGEKDIWFPDLHKVINLHDHLPNSHLWIVPNEGHVPYSDKNKHEFIRIANEFLSEAWEK